MRQNARRTLGVLASAVTVAILVSSPANADRPAESTPIVEFTMTDAGGFQFPDTLPAGYVTLKGSTTETTYHALQGFQPLNGFGPADVVENLRKGVAGATPAESAEGHQWLLRNSLLVGGVVTTLRGPVSVTIPLYKGTYYFFDVNDIFLGITPRVKTVQVVGRWRSSPLPGYDTIFESGQMKAAPSAKVGGGHHGVGHHMKTVDASMRGDDPIFRAPPMQLPANPTTFRAVVTRNELHEVVVRPTLPGITNEYLKSYYDAVRDGTPRPPAPWKLTSTGSFERSAGVQAMSPRRWAIVSFDWDAGPYALLCLVPSAVNGQPHSYIGMFHMLDLV